MKTIILAIAILAVPGLACADVPSGPDSLNGAFLRMFDRTPGRVSTVPSASADATGIQFERFVNSAARGDASSLELGFARMLARAKDVPAPLAVRGERDPVERFVTAALREQALGPQRHAGL